MAYLCNPSYLEGWAGRIEVWGQLRQIILETPHLQNNQSKMDWRCGSSSRVPALQVWSPEFKLQFHNQKKVSKIWTQIYVVDINYSTIYNRKTIYISKKMWRVNKLWHFGGWYWSLNSGSYSLQTQGLEFEAKGKKQSKSQLEIL
jgi:hypothetical protein